MSAEKRTAGETATGAGASNVEKVAAEIRRLFEIVTRRPTDDSWSFSEMTDAAETLKEADGVLSFNEWTREKGDPDNTLEDMEYLDELAECGGDWGKPTFVLARAFYGYDFNPWRDESDSREPFNPNHKYFTFNGYGNLVSVRECDWAAYWALNLDAEMFAEYAEECGRLEELADALGVELADVDGEEADA